MKKLLQKKQLMALLLMLIIVVSGCGADPVETTYDDEPTKVAAKEETEVVDDGFPYTYTDKFGNEMVIETKPETYVSFSPEITETIFALGLGENLIGRSSWCDYPAQAAQVADMGSLFSFSLEAVVAAGPDVVFLSSMANEEVYQQLVDNNLTPVILDYDINLQGTMVQIESIGMILGQKEEAEKINANIQKAIDDMTLKAADREAKSVYFAVAVGEYTSAGTGDTFLNDIITTIGAVNTAADGTEWQYTVEQIVEDNPDFIICPNNGERAQILELEGYKDLSAVTEGRLYEVDENIFFRQGPRVAEALSVLEAVIYIAN